MSVCSDIAMKSSAAGAAVLALLHLVYNVRAIPIDNGVIGRGFLGPIEHRSTIIAQAHR